MKQIEITTKVRQSLEEVDEVLINQGFTLVRKSRIEDEYMTLHLNELTENNILDILQKSVLIRFLCINGDKILRKLTYKNKEYNGDMVLSEEKINVNIDDIKNAEKLLMALGFKKLVDVKYDVIVYKKDNIEFCFQKVEGLGLLLEYENFNDFEEKSYNEILAEKRRMLSEVRSYKLDVDDDFDVKKAYQLVKKGYR